jgi:hypothetical protein
MPVDIGVNTASIVKPNSDDIVFSPPVLKVSLVSF